MAPTYKLTYFCIRGRAELMRYIFAQASVEYEDIRVEMEHWPTVKPDTPFGQLPVLEVDGVKLCQSNACARYLARKYNLAGKTDLEQAQADMFVDCLEDATKPIVTFFRETDEAKKTELKKKFNEEQLPVHLTLLEALLKQNHGGDGYLVGTELTWADLALVCHTIWASLGGGDPDPLAKYPKLKALKEKVEKLPKIVAWNAKRPQTSL